MKPGLIARIAGALRPDRDHSILFWDKVARKLRITHPDDTSDEIERVSRKGVVGGYASLDSTGKVPSSQLPASGGGLATPASSGVVAVDNGTGTTYGRTLTGTSPVTVTNGNGVSDNPTISMPAASGSQAGHLTATDWTTFNGKVGPSRSISTSAPLSGGGDFSADRSLSLSYGYGLTVSGGALVVDTGVIAEVADLAGYQPFDSDLTALAGLSSNGFLARTGAGTAAARSLTPGAGISITNQDGSGGNPTISVNSEIPSNAANTRIYYTQAEQTSLIWTGISGFNTGSGTVSVVSGITNTYNALSVTCTNANSNWPVRPGAQNVRIGHNPVFTGRFISAATTADHRIWLCFATSIGTGSTPSGQGCGVVFDPSTSANWRVYSYDGTTMSYTDTGVAYAANTMYQWSVRTTSSGVYVKIWDVTGSEPAETAHTTNLPAAGTNMYAGLFLLFRITAGSSTIKFFSQQCSMAINNA